MDFYEFNEKNEKIISLIQDCQGIFLFMDMNNRECFDNLNDYWLKFIRDDCSYESKVVIMGNYAKVKRKNSLLTSNEEINDMMTKSQIPNCTFIEIGCLDKEELVNLFDKLIEEIYTFDTQNSKSGDCKGESLKNCLIF